MGREIDVLALCETHLVNSEQCTQWDRCVGKSNYYNWIGRPAQPPIGNSHGRGSGGVGILIRKSWDPYIRHLPPCRHDCLIFIRIDPPATPFPLFIGVVYAVPIGSTRYDDNIELFNELEERIISYSALGAVVIMGDFNIHIGEYPSTIIATDSDPDSSDRILDRSSVDTVGMDCIDGVPARGSEFVNRMNTLDMVVLNGLHCVGDGMIAMATHGTHSVIDLILINTEYMNHMQSVQVISDDTHHIPSDHRLVISSLNYSSSDIASSPSSLTPNASSSFITDTRYRIRSQGDCRHFNRYQQECITMLGEMTDRWRIDNDNDIEKVWYEFETAVHSIAQSTIGERKKSDTTCQWYRYRDDVLLQQWIRNLNSVNQQIRDNYLDDDTLHRLRSNKKHIEKSIKRHKRRRIHEREEAEIKRICALKHRMKKEYWAALKRIGNLKSSSSSSASSSLSSLPLIATDALGVDIGTTDGVRSVWHDTWSQLAKHNPDEPQYDIEFRQSIENTLAADEQFEIDQPEMIQHEQQRITAAELNVPISLNEVKLSVRQLKNSKSPGSDGIVSELLKNGGDEMYHALHIICQLVWNESRVPLDWLRGVIVPIHKDGSKKEPLNYRPITLLSIAGKVYTTILHTRLMTWSEKHNIIAIEQGGFRPGRGCPEQLYALTELIKLRRLRKQHTFVCFIDIRKAYDTVWHAGMKYKLRKCGIHGSMYRAICSLYDGCESTVRLGDTLGYTDFFPIETGVRQGCILSPFLYSLFINDLASELSESEFGASIDEDGRNRLAALLYADDIVLLSDSMDHLQQLMNIVYAYSCRWRFQVNPTKCGLMKFNKDGSSTQPDDELRLGDTIVNWVQSYKYLGVELHNGVSYRDYRKRASSSATCAANRVSGMGMYSGKLPVSIGVQVYKTLVRSILEYGAEVTSLTPWKEAEQLQITMAKRILGVSTHTVNEACTGELGLMSMEARYQQLRVSFWGKIQHMSPNSPVRLIYEETMNHYAISADGDIGVPSSQPSEGFSVVYPQSKSNTTERVDKIVLWCEQLKNDLYQLGLESHWNNTALIPNDTSFSLALASKLNDTWRSKIGKKVKQKEEARWYHALSESSILRTYRTIISPTPKLELASYLTIRHGGWNDRILSGRRILTRLRTGTNELRIHRGRFENGMYLSSDQRLCRICANGDVEDEKHFIMGCQYYQHERIDLYTSIDRIINSDIDPSSTPFDFSSLSDQSKFHLLTNCHHDQVKSESIRQKLGSCILIALHQWMKMRNKFIEELDMVIDA